MLTAVTIGKRFDLLLGVLPDRADADICQRLPGHRKIIATLGAQSAGSGYSCYVAASPVNTACWATGGGAMPENVLSDVTKVFEIRSQSGSDFTAELPSYDAVVNAFLTCGWVLLSTYVEGRGRESGSEECVCLMGWSGEGQPQYPSGYAGR